MDDSTQKIPFCPLTPGISIDTKSIRPQLPIRAKIGPVSVSGRDTHNCDTPVLSSMPRLILYSMGRSQGVWSSELAEKRVPLSLDSTIKIGPSVKGGMHLDRTLLAPLTTCPFGQVGWRDSEQRATVSQSHGPDPLKCRSRSPLSKGNTTTSTSIFYFLGGTHHHLPIIALEAIHVVLQCRILKSLPSEKRVRMGNCQVQDATVRSSIVSVSRHMIGSKKCILPEELICCTERTWI